MGRISLLFAGFAVLLAPPLAAQDDSAWKVGGDLQLLYQNLWRDDRDGTDSENDVLSARLRLSLDREINSNWSFRTRLAARFDDSGNDADLFIRSHRQSPTGIEPGSVTPDQVYLRWRSDDRKTDLRIGRQTHSIRLPLIVNRSLDRDTSVNVDIGWNDGIQLIQNIAGGWKGNLFMQYNSRKGNGTANRGPTDFRDSDSRISYYAGVRNDDALGPVFFRQLGVNWSPDTLAPDGLNAPRREDYITASGKLAAGWDVGGKLGAEGTRFVLGGELGYAFEQPTEATMRIGGDGDVGGWAWQLGADLRNFVPRHNLGVLYGRVQAGWLITPGFRENEDYLELRYIFQINKGLAWELRIRQREELERRLGALDARTDRDVRTRLTWRF